MGEVSIYITIAVRKQVRVINNKETHRVSVSRAIDGQKNMGVKSLTLLFLCLSVKLQIALQMKHRCNTTTSTLLDCNNNPRIQVTKPSRKYMYQLRLCNNNSNECLTVSNNDWIKCDQVCKACKTILPQPPQGSDSK